MIQLSEAIGLGRTLIPQGHCRKDSRDTANGGCVLDMAAVAVGLKSWHSTPQAWPWLDRIDTELTGCCHKFDIAWKYDNQVLTGRITLDQLIDYVRSVEPAEEPGCAEPAAPCTDAVSLGVK